MWILSYFPQSQLRFGYLLVHRLGSGALEAGGRLDEAVDISWTAPASRLVPSPPACVVGEGTIIAISDADLLISVEDDDDEVDGE